MSTGTPLTFRCPKCMRDAIGMGWEGRIRYRVGEDWRPTGRTKTKRRYHGRSATLYEYECMTCGHTGWSNHPTVRLKLERSGS